MNLKKSSHIVVSVYIYADDMALYYSNSSYIDLMLTINDNISSVSEWLKCNNLTLNTCNKLRQVHEALIYIIGDLYERVDSF